jgi:MFS family permease
MKRFSTLRRLQISHLLMGMMFWYGIEQLFLDHYLHDASARGYLTIAFTASLLVFDIPGGILADKIGRKKALLIGCVAQVIGVIVMGASHSLAQYLIGSAIFGLCVGLLNGAAQALLYDHLAQNNITESYGKHQGSIYAMFLIGAGLANLASGIVANAFSLRAPYFLSLIPAVLAFFVLLPIVETPPAQTGSSWYRHFGDALAEIRARPRIMVFGVQFIVSQLVMMTIGEFGQIYILSFHVGAVALGLLWAAVAGFAALGRIVAHRVHGYPQLTIILYCILLLVFIRVHWQLGILLFCLVYGYNQTLANISETEVQDASKSSIRATLFSCVNLAGNILGLPVVYIFNRLYVDHSIFTANALLTIMAVFVLLITVVFARRLRPQSIASEA